MANNTVVAKWGKTGHAADEMPYIVGSLQNAGRHPRGVPSTDEAAGGQLVSPASYLLGQNTHQRGVVAGSQITHAEIGSHNSTESVAVRADLNSAEDHVGDLVGADGGIVGHLNVEVNEKGLGHGSSNRDGDQRSVTGSGANRKGWDGDTSSPERAAPVISFDAEMSNQGEPSEHAYLTRKLRRAISSEATGVRRLTPVECERLQALPDHWTAHGPDSRRYAALGDAVTSSVAEWIGRRILAAA